MRGGVGPPTPRAPGGARPSVARNRAGVVFFPAVNTAILLASSVTVTIAHHALLAGHRTRLKIFLAATFLLGFTFVYLQATEYHEAYTTLVLQLPTATYASAFFTLTRSTCLHI